MLWSLRLTDDKALGISIRSNDLASPSSTPATRYAGHLSSSCWRSQHIILSRVSQDEVASSGMSTLCLYVGTPMNRRSSKPLISADKCLVNGSLLSIIVRRYSTRDIFGA